MCNEVFFYVIRVTCSQSTCCNNFLLDIINIMRRCNTQNETHTKMPVGRNVTVGTVSERCLNSVGTVYSDPSAQNVRESVRLKRSRSVECSVLRHVGFCDTSKLGNFCLVVGRICLATGNFCLATGNFCLVIVWRVDGVELCRKILHIQDMVCAWIELRLWVQHVVGVECALCWRIMFLRELARVLLYMYCVGGHNAQPSRRNRERIPAR